MIQLYIAEYITFCYVSHNTFPVRVSGLLMLPETAVACYTIGKVTENNSVTPIVSA